MLNRNGRTAIHTYASHCLEQTVLTKIVHTKIDDGARGQESKRRGKDVLEREFFCPNGLSLNAPGAHPYPVSPPGLTNHHL